MGLNDFSDTSAESCEKMIYTGKNIKADEAHRIGLVNKLFDSNDELLAASRKTLSLIASKSRVTLEQCKTVINRSESLDIEKGLDLEAKGFYNAFNTEDKKEGVNAFIEKEQQHSSIVRNKGLLSSFFFGGKNDEGNRLCGNWRHG